MITILATLCIIILVALAIFQISLIAGAPIGNYAWGGSHRVLPSKLKIGSAISILIYGLIAIVILAKVGMITLNIDQNLIDVFMWIIAGYFTLGIFMNAISRSKKERNLMTPVALVLAIFCIIIAAS
ncbi:MAG: hypothetical protein V4611_02620 [Patescibacteria group bacterium]